MDMNEAQALTIRLMNDHGIWQQGWRFGWMNGKRIMGMVRERVRDFVRTKTLLLSRHMVRLNDESVVRNTILHEIAHAIAGLDNGHNYVWKAVCIAVGANPERCANPAKVNQVKHKYQVACQCCNHVLSAHHRRPNFNRLQRSYCSTCGQEKSFGKLIVVTT